MMDPRAVALRLLYLELCAVCEDLYDIAERVRAKHSKTSEEPTGKEHNNESTNRL